MLLSNERISNELYTMINKINTGSSKILRDIHDAELYKELLSTGEKMLTLNFNIDGAPMFHKSKRAIWNLQLSINEFPLDLRYSLILIAAICIVDREPKPEYLNMVLKTFVEQIDAINNNRGIQINCKLGIIKDVKVKLLCGCLDAPAQAKVQNLIQFNGYCGWSYCYQQVDIFCNCVRYPVKDTKPAIRTNERYKKDVKL